MTETFFTPDQRTIVFWRGGETPIALVIAAACVVSAVVFWRVVAPVRVSAKEAPAAESAVI